MGPMDDTLPAPSTKQTGLGSRWSAGVAYATAMVSLSSPGPMPSCIQTSAFTPE